MKYEKEEIKSLWENETSKTEVAKAYCKMKGIDYNETVRKAVTSVINAFSDKDFENISETDTNQYEKISQLSALKGDGSIMTIEEYCNFYKIPFSHVRTYKLVTHTGKGAYYNIASNAILPEHQEEFFRKIISEISKIKSLPKTIVRNPSDTEGFLLVLDPADIHIGKLSDSFETGEDYNNQIAVQRVKEGVEGILDKVKGFKIDKILFVGGNDILHIDTPKRTTTSGTYQDTDGMWYSSFLIAKQLYVEILKRLLEIADVHFVYNPSNHDYVNGFFLADVIQTYFKNSDNITFDCSITHRKYYRYYDNLIGTTHGDGAKDSDLPLLMAHEAKEDWGGTKHKYIYTHHIHHKKSRDYMGVNVESLRSPSATDSWHHRNGFQHAPKAVEAFLHSKEYGQIARITHLF